MSLFGAEAENSAIFYIDPKELTKKFKEYKGMIKIFLEEENSLREGLIKTSETSKTFSNLLKYLYFNTKAPPKTKNNDATKSSAF